MKAKIISIVNQKGGAGKTTTAAALHNALTFKGYKCLSVDVNAQRNLSQCLNADTGDKSVLDVLLNPAEIKEAIISVPQGDVLAGNKGLANIDILQAQAGTENTYTALKEAFTLIRKDYDFIVLDTPPFMGTLLLNCLLSSDYYIIAAEADAFSLSAVEDIIENITDLQSAYGAKIKAAGILLTRYTGRAALSKQLLEVFNKPAKAIHTQVFSTPIREGIAIKEAHLMRQSLYEYALKSKPAQDYLAFTEELLTRI